MADCYVPENSLRNQAISLFDLAYDKPLRAHIANRPFLVFSCRNNETLAEPLEYRIRHVVPKNHTTPQPQVFNPTMVALEEMGLYNHSSANVRDHLRIALASLFVPRAKAENPLEYPPKTHRVLCHSSSSPHLNAPDSCLSHLYLPSYFHARNSFFFATPCPALRLRSKAIQDDCLYFSRSCSHLQNVVLCIIMTIAIPKRFPFVLCAEVKAERCPDRIPLFSLSPKPRRS